MASDTLPNRRAWANETSAEDDTWSLFTAVPAVLRPLASLRLTCVLFAMAIFIVLVGTLAQADSDTWDVVRDYFRIDKRDFWLDSFPWINLGACFAKVNFQTFFPKSFFPELGPVAGYIYFPKGWLIGFVMALNLLAAHLVRFKIQSSGTRLSAGLAVLSAGCLTTYLVIRGGSNSEGFQADPLIAYGTLWTLIKVGLVLTFVGVAAAALRMDPTQRVARSGLLAVAVFLAALLGYLFIEGDASQLSDPSMRILWQLIQGSLAGLVLLAGCVLVFKKRAGIVLLHGGVGLLMFSELLVGTTAVETQMVINEGQTVGSVFDIRTLELTVTDPSPADHDEVVVVPMSILKRGSEPVTKIIEIPGRPEVKIGVLQNGAVVKDPELPFDVEMIEYLPNSNIRKIMPRDTSNKATAGAGLTLIADPQRPGAGADAGGAIDVTSVYVKLLDKKDGHPLGTYLVSPMLNGQKIEVDGKPYTLSLQFKQTAKPYSLKLLDIRKNDYTGTSTPKDYSSYVRLVDPTRNVDREVRIWMNNPLRFAGETFYQSSYHKDPATGLESTTLSIVSNSGWMIPYVACMIVATGMLAQFVLTLSRFLNRQTDDERKKSLLALAIVSPLAAAIGATMSRETAKISDSSPKRGTTPPPRSPEKLGRALWAAPLTAVALAALLVGYDIYKASDTRKIVPEMRIDEFAQLPVLHEGRCKPMETLARNTLRVVSNKQTFKDAEGKRVPAIRWMLDVISGSPAAEEHRVFRIDNPDLLTTLGLDAKALKRDSHLFSLAEMRPKLEEFEKQVEIARNQQRLDKTSTSLYQRKVLELNDRFRTYMQLDYAFQPLPVTQFLTPEMMKDPTAAKSMVTLVRSRMGALMEKLNSDNPPLAVAVNVPAADGKTESQWQTYTQAVTDVLLQYMEAQATREPPKEKPSASAVAFLGMMTGYKDGKAQTFNEALQEYKAAIGTMQLADVDQEKLSFEVFFDRAEPFWWLAALYVVAFVLAAISWLGWRKPLNRAAFALLVFTFVVHSAALIGRIYISGRPPVTNLYSSAVFIGWGCVALGLALEAVYRLGIGNLIAAVSGFGALGIAHLLTTEVPSFRGDTFTVLQAVLDTQFWLATHVVCITLGYATTFVAGGLANLYILQGVLTSKLDEPTRKAYIRMIYGSVCFALFFSFVGTVLGGLWADDSWGRFWGWDPKENGALIIVLWDALVLHARWGAWVKDRGLAVLAVGGNIVTAWSWFGVNELGIGLHSYGFTEGVLQVLAMFVVSQLVIGTLGALPPRFWQSYRANPAV